MPNGPVGTSEPGDRLSRDVDLRFVGHATVLLEAGGLRILTDPFLRARLGPLDRHGPVPDADALGAIDVVVISHGHPDHLDPRSLGAIRGRPLVIVPRGLAATVQRHTDGEVIEVVAGDAVALPGAVIGAVPARHWISPGAPRAQPLGYVIDVGARIYFAGDTGPFDGMDAATGPIDIALLPIWTWGPHLGPGHLGPRSAADVVARLRPQVAVPIHWGTLYPRRLHRVWAGPLRDPGDRFAAHVGREAPGVAVHVLRPGDGVHLEMKRRTGP